MVRFLIGCDGIPHCYAVWDAIASDAAEFVLDKTPQQIVDKVCRDFAEKVESS